MPDTVNPYIPGQPIDDPELFFGRREAFPSIREHLLKGRRIFVVSGAHRMGKTSVLRQLPTHLPEEYFPVQVELMEESPQHFDWLLWRLASLIGHEVSRHLDVEGLEPDWGDFEGQTDELLQRFWPQVRAILGDRCLVLMLDDLDCLVQEREGQADLLGPLIALLSDWQDRDDALAVVLTLSPGLQEALAREYPRLFGSAPTYALGPLSGEEAVRLITWPVDGVLTYDYGVTRRLTELTSGHPYYLQLLCFEVFNRCVSAGWVNQRDLDLVEADLIAREIDDFCQIWDASSPAEQAVLAALVSMRGARGVATVQEVRNTLVKAGTRVDRTQVTRVLESLVARGVLQQLGALSYRFRVALLRDWLGERMDVEKVVRGIREDAWEQDTGSAGSRMRTLRIRKERQRELPRSGRERAEAEEDEADGRPWLWIGAVAVLSLVVLAGVGFVLSTAPVEPIPPSPTARAASATPTLVPTFTPQPAPVSSPTETEVPTPRPTASPTPPVIVARPVPAIVYQSKRSGEQRWSIYVMDSDGSNRTRLTDGQWEALGPVWSQDGSKIAFSSDRDNSLDIWVMDSDGSNPVNLTREEAKDRWPAWSPDGEWLAFSSVRDTLYWELYVMRVDGSDVQRLTWWEDASDWAPTWSPDGTRLAFASYRDENWEIYTMDRDGSNLVRLTNNPADDTSPSWSPDGGRIAFESTRDGYTDIYVMPVGGGKLVNLTNLPWATDLGPTWSPDGSRIAFYSDRDGEWDIYVMSSDGSDVIKLTGDSSIDQVPSWRP